MRQLSSVLPTLSFAEKSRRLTGKHDTSVSDLFRRKIEKDLSLKSIALLHKNCCFSRKALLN